MSWLWLLLAAAVLAALGSGRFGKREGVLQARRGLALVTLCSPGDGGADSLQQWASDCLREELGLNAVIEPIPVTIPKDAFHPQRGQADAVQLVEIVETMVRPELAVLGLTEYDLHSPLRRDLPFALGARKGWAGLISTYRMEDRGNQENTRERLRKMLVRYAAEIVCEAPRNHDPQSVLYDDLQRPEQLDIMVWP